MGDATPQSLTSRWKTTRFSFFLRLFAGQPEALARARRNIDRFHFCFARRLFWSSSSGLTMSQLGFVASFVSVISSLSILALRLILLEDDHKPSGRSCRNPFLITHSLTDEVLEEEMQHTNALPLLTYTF